MDPRHFDALQALRRCRFLPGSFDKRFVRDLAALGEYDLLTPKQEANIDRLAYRYRRQLAQSFVPRKAEYR